jgi:translation initiation factor 3 subunit E
MGHFGIAPRRVAEKNLTILGPASRTSHISTTTEKAYPLCALLHSTPLANHLLSLSATRFTHGSATMGDSVADDAIAKEHDLLAKMIPHMDRHLIWPLLGVYEETPEITRVKYELFKTTNMIDFIGQLDADIRGLDEPAPEFAKKREDVFKRQDQYEEQCSKITGLLQDSEVVGNLRSDKVANLNYLKENHGVTNEMVDLLYESGMFQYSMGLYGNAADLLYQFRVLSTDNDKVGSATWGKLASEILSTNWETAMEEVQRIKENIDTRLFSNPLAQLQHRTFLIHWSLFPFFNYEPARDTLTELFFSPAFINTIQTSCPWILRYLVAAVITNRGRSRNSNAYQKQLKDLVRVVRQEAYEYSDPVTDFVRALYVDFDFEEAQKKLSEASVIFENDFFLTALADNFVDSARHLISESYCKIHQRIDIK